MKNLSVLIIAILIYSCSSDSPVSTFKGQYFQIMGVVDSIYAPAGTSAVDSSYIGHINYSDPDSVVCTFDYIINNFSNIQNKRFKIKYGNCNSNNCNLIRSDTNFSYHLNQISGSYIIKNIQPELILERDLYTESYLYSNQFFGDAYLIIRNLRLYIYEH